MKEKDLLKFTDKMDLQGKKKFILKTGGFWALFLFIFMTIFLTVNDLDDYDRLSSFLLSKHFLIIIISEIIVIPIAGYFHGLWQWKYYHRKKEKLLEKK